MNQTKRQKLIAGNWKMNGDLGTNSNLLAGLNAGMFPDSCEVLVCVPSVYLPQVSGLVKSTAIKLGAQDVSAKKSGAFTGEISSAMLAEFNCQFVIVGHSERRAYHRESNELVAQKALRALELNITPIVCVGETLEERELGKTSEIVLTQLQAVLNVLSDQDLEKIVVAYEPVWAIGTGKTATPEVAQEVHASLRILVSERSIPASEKLRILYGGSMKSDNAKELLAMPDIDGGLIGGASLKVSDFLAILSAV